MFTILSTQTKIALIFSLIIFLSIIKNYYNKKIIFVIIPSFICLFILVRNTDTLFLNDIINRFILLGDSNPRIGKTFLSIDLMMNSFGTFLWGLPEIIISRTVNNVVVSDNSFFLIQLKFGFIMTMIWLTTTIYMIKKNSTPSMLCWLWFFISLSVTNSIAWDSYIICLAAVMLMNPLQNPNKINC